MLMGLILYVPQPQGFIEPASTPKSDQIQFSLSFSPKTYHTYMEDGFQ